MTTCLVAVLHLAHSTSQGVDQLQGDGGLAEQLGLGDTQHLLQLPALGLQLRILITQGLRLLLDVLLVLDDLVGDTKTKNICRVLSLKIVKP